MEKLKIEQGIKVVAIAYNGNSAESHEFPFESMQVGDSFLLKCSTERRVWSNYNEHYARLYNKLYQYKKSVNKGKPYNDKVAFVIRAVANGYRCWRTK